MGYSYSRTSSGRMALDCDACGSAGSTRKRTCPYKVTSDSLRGARYALPYCYPAALCPECYGKHKATLHTQCKEGAARAQAEYDANEARLEAGAFLVVAAWGDWQGTVPAGKVGVCFRGRQGERYALVPASEYDSPGARTRALEEFTAEPWPEGPQA